MCISCTRTLNLCAHTCNHANTTTEAQGTTRKRDRSDPEGVDSEPGMCAYVTIQCHVTAN